MSFSEPPFLSTYIRSALPLFVTLLSSLDSAVPFFEERWSLTEDNNKLLSELEVVYYLDNSGKFKFEISAFNVLKSVSECLAAIEEIQI